MKEYEEALIKTLDELKDMLISKHHDYGGKNLLRHGFLGINVRLDDKLARIDNLLKENVQEKCHDETIEKTYMDIAGYAIQAILMNREQLY